MTDATANQQETISIVIAEDNWHIATAIVSLAKRLVIDAGFIPDVLSGNAFQNGKSAMDAVMLVNLASKKVLAISDLEMGGGDRDGNAFFEGWHNHDPANFPASVIMCSGRDAANEPIVQALPFYDRIGFVIKPDLKALEVAIKKRIAEIKTGLATSGAAPSILPSSTGGGGISGGPTRGGPTGSDSSGSLPYPEMR